MHPADRTLGDHVSPNQNHPDVSTPMADLPSIERWLQIYAGLPGRIVVSSPANGWSGTFFHTDPASLAQAATHMAAIAERTDVYLRCTTVDDTVSDGRGKGHHTVAIPGLWSDLDGLWGHHKSDDLPPDRDAAMSLLDGMPEPTIVLDSGGGLYAWWLFDTPVVVDGDLHRWQQLSHGWNQLLADRGKKKGWDVDNVGDLPRVLRPLGALNHKGETPSPIRIYEHSRARHTPADLETWLAEHRPAPDATIAPPATSAGSNGGRSQLASDLVDRWTVADELRVRGIDVPRDRKIKCPLPDHDDNSPSCHVYDSAEGWYCYGCTRGGSVIDLVMRLDDADYDRAVATLAPRIGREPPVTAVTLLPAPPKPIPAPAVDGGEDDGGEPAEPPTLAYEPGQPPLNDAGNGVRFAATHAHQARYVYAWNGWIVWDGHKWNRDSGARIDELAQDVVDRILIEAYELEPEARKALIKWHIGSGNVNRTRNMLVAARHRTHIDELALDVHPWELNTPSGIVDLLTGRIAPHNPDRNHTKITGAPYAPGTEAPTWEKFLEQVMPDPAVRAYLQRLTGAAAAGTIREHVLPIHYGTGANGKSTFVDAITKALGEYARPVSVQVLMDGKRNPDAPAPEIAGLRGTRLAVAQEPELGQRLRESTVKHLTGGDRIVARRLYQDPFEFDPTHSLWLVTNHKPDVRGTDDGIWRRIALVPWAVTIPTDARDPDLPRRLEDELPGILKWIVDGAVAWAAIGLQPPEAVTSATAGYRSESDRLRPWMDDRCVLDDDAREEPGALYADYEKWCQDVAEDPVNKHTFYVMLTERGYEPGKSNGKRVRKGIGLREAEGRAGTPIQANLSVSEGDEA